MKTESSHTKPNAESPGTPSDVERSVSTQRRQAAKPRSGVVSSLAALRLCAFALMLLPIYLCAATNDLTAALQKGLFEEEVNHNLDAAAQAYQAVSARFDQDRKLAVTAIFRLGEVYRKQGKTNEAKAQYERVVREFSDQQTLATLSRQNLAGLRQSPPVLGDIPLLAGLGKPSEEARKLADQLTGLEQLKDDPEKQARAVLALFPDEDLKRMLVNLPLLQKQETRFKTNSDPGRPIFVAITPDEQRGFGDFPTNLAGAQAELQRQLTSISDRVNFIISNQKARLQVLQSVAAKAPVSEAATTENSALADDDEEKEIRRIQTMIQNSPDLINSPSRGANGDFTPLCWAAREGQLRVAKFLLDNGAAIDRRADADNRTTLHVAVEGGHKAMVELLLSKNADVRAADANGRTPLHDAAWKGYQSVIEVLLTHNSDINAKDKIGRTPLFLAVGDGQSATVAVLLEKGADANIGDKAGWTPLTQAAILGQVPVLKQLLAGKADVNLQDNGGRTALGFAANGQLEAVKALLAAKADPNTGTLDLPLAMALRGKHLEIAVTLLRAGADPNLAGKLSSPIGSSDGPLFGDGVTGPSGPYTPLQIASARLDGAMVKLLFQFKADANAKAPWTAAPTPLTGYVLRGDTEILKTFLEAGADANAEASQGVPLLVEAASDGNAAAVESLLAHGAKPDIQSLENRTPLSYAAERNCLKCVELLLTAKADPNATTSSGLGALHMAVKVGSKEMAEALIAHGADVNAKTQNGGTPLHHAVGYGRKEIVAMLLDKGANPNIRNNEGQTPLDIMKIQASAPVAGIPFQPGEAPRANPKELAALLRQHGALDDLPKLDRIEVRRAGYSAIVFWKGTNDWNRFTTLELIGVEYGILATQREARRYGYDANYLNPWSVRNERELENPLPFPDFAHVVIHRPTTDGRTRQAVTIDVGTILQSGDCAKDATLNWGDVVDIPELDHPVNEKWTGFSPEALNTFQKCLARKITIAVKDQTVPLSLGPGMNFENGKLVWLSSNRPFALLPVLNDSKLLRSSSDLSRVKVTRHEHVSGKQLEWIVDCTGGKYPDLWLRDGDVIEVPDKP